MAKKATIQPWEDVIIVTDPPEDVTEQGVILPGMDADNKKTPEKGIVQAVGSISKESQTLRKLLEKIRPGDMIYYERYTANKIPDQGVEYNFVRFKYIMGWKKL